MERIRSMDARVIDWASQQREQCRDVDACPVDTVADLQAQREREREQVLELGRAEGYAQGLLRAESEVRARVQAVESQVEERHATQSKRLDTAVARMEELLKAFPEALADVDRRVEAIAVEAAFAAVTRLLGERLVDRSLMSVLCTQALADYRQRPVLIRVAMDDVAALAGLVDGSDVRVVGDVQLRHGQCQLETHKGLYDTGLDVRLEAMKQAFLRAIPGATQ